MASFEPVVLLFASPQDLSTFDFRLPVTFAFAIDENSLDKRVSFDPPLHESCLQRYFVILFQLVGNEVLERLQNNHRIQVIYTQESLTPTSAFTKPHRIINKQLQQFTLDLTADIAHFLTIEGEKQARLERLNLTGIYYRQVRLLKEWAMSFAKAEPCHILVIPLNTTQENLNGAVERIEQCCNTRGYPSFTIRTLADYLPTTAENQRCLLPYSDALFNNEHPDYICRIITRLSPIRLYLYGNEENICSRWSETMASLEKTVMEDEDSWCAFIENECISDEMKWSIGTMFASKWQVKRISPINLSGLNGNLRFQSALRRALKTLNPRQIEITSEIFIWYDKCIREKYLELQPKLSLAEEMKINPVKYSHPCSRVDNRAFIRYAQAYNFESLSFVWLDDLSTSADDYLNEIIQPYIWNCFHNVADCLAFIETQVRERSQIFLVASGSLGYELFISANRLVSAVSFVYIYCSQIGRHTHWTRNFEQIQGVFNDSLILGKQVQANMEHAQQIQDRTSLVPSKARSQRFYEADYDSTSITIPITVYKEEQRSAFIAHQRTIDTLLCLPHTPESRIEMIEEFRRIYANDDVILAEIDLFDQTYNSHNAFHWYTRDSFFFRTINRALRSSDAEAMFKFRHFLIDAYAQLTSLHPRPLNYYYSFVAEKLYRGQIMTRNEFDSFHQLIGQIISINTFFSASESLQVALAFVESLPHNDDCLPVIVCIEPLSMLYDQRPYAKISHFSNYGDEEEVLFAMGHVFRVRYIERLDQTNSLPVIHLKMVTGNELQEIPSI